MGNLACACESKARLEGVSESSKGVSSEAPILLPPPPCPSIGESRELPPSVGDRTNVSARMASSPPTGFKAALEFIVPTSSEGHICFEATQSDKSHYLPTTLPKDFLHLCTNDYVVWKEKVGDGKSKITFAFRNDVIGTIGVGSNFFHFDSSRLPEIPKVLEKDQTISNAHPIRGNEAMPHRIPPLTENAVEQGNAKAEPVESVIAKKAESVETPKKEKTNEVTEQPPPSKVEQKSKENSSEPPNKEVIQQKTEAQLRANLDDWLFDYALKHPGSLSHSEQLEPSGSKASRWAIRADGAASELTVQKGADNRFHIMWLMRGSLQASPVEGYDGDTAYVLSDSAGPKEQHNQVLRYLRQKLAQDELKKNDPQLLDLSDVGSEIDAFERALELYFKNTSNRRGVKTFASDRTHVTLPGTELPSRQYTITHSSGETWDPDPKMHLKVGLVKGRPTYLWREYRDNRFAGDEREVTGDSVWHADVAGFQRQNEILQDLDKLRTLVHDSWEKRKDEKEKSTGPITFYTPFVVKVDNVERTQNQALCQEVQRYFEERGFKGALKIDKKQYQGKVDIPYFTCDLRHDSANDIIKQPRIRIFIEKNPDTGRSELRWMKLDKSFEPDGPSLPVSSNPNDLDNGYRWKEARSGWNTQDCLLDELEEVERAVNRIWSSKK